MKALVDVIPSKARRYVYAGATLLVAGLTAWQAADHNWLAAALTVGLSLATELARANTSKASPSDEAK